MVRKDQPMTATVDIVQELCAELIDAIFELSPIAPSG
jgi:hypothetical protein